METKNFEIKIQNFKTQVWLHVYQSENVSLKDIMIELKNQGISFGLNKLILKRLTEENFPYGEYLIAEGSTPINGEDARVECMVTITPPPLEVAINSESSNYFPVRITNVRKGQRLFRITKSTEGVPGYNVFGEEIPAIKGKNTYFTKGRNIDYDEGQNYLIATKDGNFVYEGSDAHVETDYYVNGDLSIVNGQLIEFYGNLIVQGDIRIGITIKVDGNLTVNGAVEDAVIECGGTVDVKGGFRGNGRGRVVSDGDIKFLHGHNYTITSRSNMIIGKIAMNCNLTAKSIESPMGSICGGSTLAFKKIEIQSLGRESYSKTTVAIAGKLNHMILSNERDTEISNILRKVQLCESKLSYLSKTKDNRALSRDQEENIYVVKLAYEQLNDLLYKRRHEKEELQHELRGISLKLLVHGTIYESVHLMMNDIDIPIVENVSNVMFTEKDYRITRGKNF